jgi:hypothetical protein
VTGPHPNYCFYVSPPAFCARLCCFLRVQLWTSESTKHANDAGTSKSSPSFWRSCRKKLTKEVYRFSPIWHISSVKITRALDDAVPFSNNSRQQWPWRRCSTSPRLKSLTEGGNNRSKVARHLQDTGRKAKRVSPGCSRMPAARWANTHREIRNPFLIW